MNGYQAFQLYLALKQHFSTPSYDFIKYNGKVRTSPASYDKRKDKYFFEKLAKVRDPQQRIVSCLISDITWIRDMISQDGEKAELQYTKTLQGISHAYKTDLNTLRTPLDILLRVAPNSMYPPLLSAYINESVSIQTMLVLDQLVGYLDHWNQLLKDDLMWPDIFMKISKYKPFLTVDKQKMRQITIDWMESIDKYEGQDTVDITPKQPQH
jgi:hypothetical protein